MTQGGGKPCRPGQHSFGCVRRARSLGDMLQEGGYFSESTILKYLAQILLALKSCHQNKDGSTHKPILHRFLPAAEL